MRAIARVTSNVFMGQRRANGAIKALAGQFWANESYIARHTEPSTSCSFRRTTSGKSYSKEPYCACAHTRALFPPKIELFSFHLKASSFHREFLKVIHSREDLSMSSRNKTQCTKNFKRWEKQCYQFGAL